MNESLSRITTALYWRNRSAWWFAIIVVALAALIYGWVLPAIDDAQFQPSDPGPTVQVYVHCAGALC